MPSRFFSYDPEAGFEFHETREGAKKEAAEALGWFMVEAPRADGADPEEVDQVCWGQVIEQVEIQKRGGPRLVAVCIVCEEDERNGKIGPIPPSRPVAEVPPKSEGLVAKARNTPFCQGEWGHCERRSWKNEPHQCMGDVAHSADFHRCRWCGGSSAGYADAFAPPLTAPAKEPTKEQIAEAIKARAELADRELRARYETESKPSSVVEVERLKMDMEKLHSKLARTKQWNEKYRADAEHFRVERVIAANLLDEYMLPGESMEDTLRRILKDRDANASGLERNERARTIAVGRDLKIRTQELREAHTKIDMLEKELNKLSWLGNGRNDQAKLLELTKKLIEEESAAKSTKAALARAVERVAEVQKEAGERFRVKDQMLADAHADLNKSKKELEAAKAESESKSFTLNRLITEAQSEEMGMRFAGNRLEQKLKAADAERDALRARVDSLQKDLDASNQQLLMKEKQS